MSCLSTLNKFFILFNKAARYKFKQYLIPHVNATYKQINIMTLIISATNRSDSNSLKISQYYQKQLQQQGVDAQILALTDLPESIINNGKYGTINPDMVAIQELITNSQKFIFVVPEYNGSFPGILKLLIDSLKFPDSFFNKKSALVGHSTGKYGNIRGIDHLTGICNYVNLHVLPLKIHIPYINKEIDEHGDFFKEDTIKFTQQQINQFVNF
jgi:NAD(P)H-dependent FMN reductase